MAISAKKRLESLRRRRGLSPSEEIRARMALLAKDRAPLEEEKTAAAESPFMAGFEKKADALMKKMISQHEKDTSKKVDPNAYRAAFDREKTRYLARGWSVKGKDDLHYLHMKSHAGAQSDKSIYAK